MVLSKSQRTLLIVLVLALLAVLAVSALHDDDGGTSDGSGQATAPTVVSASQLSDFVAESGDTVYWIGPRRGARYELTETEPGRVYVRYLRDGAQAGDERPDFVTVATYPGDGVAELRQAASDGQGALKPVAGGGIVLTDPAAPDSVHLAHPGEDVQIEVYSPIPDHALRLASRGEVERVP